MRSRVHFACSYAIVHPRPHRLDASTNVCSLSSPRSRSISWLESYGTNLRCGNLTADLRWGDVQQIESAEHHCSIQVVNTKRATAASRNATNTVNLRLKVSRDLDDHVSDTLAKEYGKRFAKDRQPSDYFFPKMARSDLIWHEHLQNDTHNQLIQEAVCTMKYADETRSKLYTTTSIRVGNNVVTEDQVRRYRAQRYKQLGWAANSSAPLTHYTPDSVALAPGPLFWDIEELDTRFLDAIKLKRKKEFAAILCVECGMPFGEGKAECFCDGCNSRRKTRGTSTHSNVGHSIRCPRFGKTRPSTTPPQQVLDAWAQLGCPFQIVHTASGYQLRKLRGRHVALFVVASVSGDARLDQYQRSNRRGASASIVI